MIFINGGAILKKYNYLCNHILGIDLEEKKEMFVNGIFEDYKLYLRNLKENHLFKYCPLCGTLLDHSFYGRQVKRYSEARKEIV